MCGRLRDGERTREAAAWLKSAKGSLAGDREGAAREGVGGALVVQPANHMHDHSYVSEALKAHPTFFRGMGLANPTLPPEEAIAALEALHTAGFVGELGL